MFLVSSGAKESSKECGSILYAHEQEYIFFFLKNDLKSFRNPDGVRSEIRRLSRTRVEHERIVILVVVYFSYFSYTSIDI